MGHWHPDEFCDDYFGLRDLLANWSYQIPRLQAITIVAYMADRQIPKEHAEVIKDAIARLFVAVEKLSLVRVVLMDYSEQWQIRNHPGKELFMQWTSDNPPPPPSKHLPFNDPGKELEWRSRDPPPPLSDKDMFVEPCCEHLFTEALKDWDDDWFMKECMAEFWEDHWAELSYP
jgi:hypothetical protein